MNSFYLGSRTSMVHQNSTQSGDEPRVTIPHTYLILASRTQTLHIGQSYFHAQKYHSEIGCHNIKIKDGTIFISQILQLSLVIGILTNFE